ncbi:MAG: hypothetical protein KF888_09690 [Nitrosomonas sp.]|nr:hypothetical protein [Nitrosomonas sp.]
MSVEFSYTLMLVFAGNIEIYFNSLYSMGYKNHQKVARNLLLIQEGELIDIDAFSVQLLFVRRIKLNRIFYFL